MINKPFFRFHLHASLLAVLVGAAIPAAARTELLVVTTASDGAAKASSCTPQLVAGVGTDAACSLRDALAQAALSTAASNSISFDAMAFPVASTIALTAGTLQLPSNTVVHGPTAGAGASLTNLLTISGKAASTVFTVSAGTVGAQLANLNIAQGSATAGGGIVNAGTLVVTSCSISGNAAKSSTGGVATAGGGVWNSGTLTISGSTVSANSASAVNADASGGGIQNLGTLKLTNSTVARNAVSADGNGVGGGIFTTDTPGSSLALTNSTVSLNTADGVGGGVFFNYAPGGAMPQLVSRERGLLQNPEGGPRPDFKVGPGLTLQTLGDSITYGSDSSGCPAPYKTPVPLASSKCWAGLLATELGDTLDNLAVSGSGVGDVSVTQIYGAKGASGNDYGQFQQGESSVAALLVGENDNGFVNGESYYYFNGTRNMTEWEMQHEDVVAFMLTPNKTPAASSTCKASAGWTASPLWTQGGLETTTNGASLSCPILGSTAYISVMAEVGNVSSISIAIDGGAARTYSYALSSKSVVLGNTTSGELFRIPNLAPQVTGSSAIAAPHTVTVTANVNGSSPVYLNWIDGNGNEQNASGGPIVFALSPYISSTQTLTNGHIQGFRNMLAVEQGDFTADGLHEVVGDLTIPCTVIPIADPAVSLCDVADGNHPSDSGHALIAAYVEQLFQNYSGLANSIVAGNTAPTGTDTYGVYTDDGGNQVGVSGIGLAALGASGGPTETMVPMPVSPALCAGIAANLNGATMDQRGLQRTVVYGGKQCVDAGAVQSNYALSFSTEPLTAVGDKLAIAPAPAVGLTESGVLAETVPGAVSMADSDALLTGAKQASLASGVAAFNNLVLTTAQASDTLVATFPLAPKLNLTAVSAAFRVLQTGAALVSPAPGSTFTSSSVTFTWAAAAGATNYYLWIGSTGVGSSDIYYSAPKTATSYTFGAMPTNGETIYVRLITNYSGTWISSDYVFAAEANAAVFTSPAPGATFTGSSVTFNWNAIPGATNYYLWIGSTGAGSSNLYFSAPKTATSFTFGAMPTNGEAIYVRLITNYSGIWLASDYVFAAEANAAAFTSPAPGATFTGSSVTFNWNAIPGATNYYLWIGSTGVGSSDLYFSAPKTVTSFTFGAMPTNGEAIYVRLITNYSNIWLSSDSTYTAGAAP